MGVPLNGSVWKVAAVSKFLISVLRTSCEHQSISSILGGKALIHRDSYDPRCHFLRSRERRRRRPACKRAKKSRRDSVVGQERYRTWRTVARRHKKGDS